MKIAESPVPPNCISGKGTVSNRHRALCAKFPFMIALRYDVCRCDNESGDINDHFGFLSNKCNVSQKF